MDDGQTIEARLWEDPLAAVALARHGPEPQPPYLVEKLRKSVTDTATGKDARLLVLGVMVTGEPYTDDTETRRRTRYAVLAGLYRSRFVPVNPDHIGYLQDDESAPSAAASGGRQNQGPAPADAGITDVRNTAAFEWFKRDTAATVSDGGSNAATPKTSNPPLSDHVLVLWLDQGGFRDLPIRRLSKFLTSIAGADDGLVKVAILGPASSDGLYAMYDEAQKAKGDAHWPVDLRRMDFYSPRATASDRSITNNQDVTLADLICTFSKGKIRLFRTVSNDYDVARAVLKELGRRWITKHGQIALVAERDTLYARNMGGYFGGCRNPPRTDPSPQEVKEDRNHVACFTYLRGLDGLTPIVPAATKAPSQGPPPKGTDQSAASGSSDTASDEATGPSQLDYLRRLASTIAELRKTKPHIRAIGVVSGDVYDKLLVLQALHGALPGAVYFTFDLDARLLEQKSLPWTRQLIVGSSLGLALRPELQGDIPPFRDSYQTATFFAAMLAVHRFDRSDAALPSDGERPAGLQWTAQPRIFEIGRSQEFDLIAKSDGTGCDFDYCPQVVATRDNWLWSTPPSPWTGQGLLAGLVLAALTLLAAGLSIGVRGVVGLSRTHLIPGFGAARWRTEASSVLMLLVVVVVTVLLWPFVVQFITHCGTTVPAPFFSGANQWTSCVVDTLAIITVVLLVVRGQRKLHDNADSVGREFGMTMTRKKLIQWHRRRLREARNQNKEKGKDAAAAPAANQETQPRPGELPGWLTWIWFPLRPLSPRSGIELAGDGVSPLEAIVAQYLHHGTAAARAWRVAPVTFLTVLFLVIPLEQISGIARFGRLPDWISFIGLLAMQFLIFWTADALLLSRSFILALKRDKPEWPEKTDILGLPRREATLWLDLRLIAARTRGVSRLVWYPSFLIAAMAVAAVTIQFGEFQFANNPVALGVGTLFVIGTAIALRRAAEALRTEIRRCFENQRLRAPNTPFAKQIKLLLVRIDRLHEGAFAPYSEQPIVRAVLVPAATYGATVGLQYLHMGP